MCPTLVAGFVRTFLPLKLEAPISERLVSNPDFAGWIPALDDLGVFDNGVCPKIEFFGANEVMSVGFLSGRQIFHGQIPSYS